MSVKPYVKCSTNEELLASRERLVELHNGMSNETTREKVWTDVRHIDMQLQLRKAMGEGCENF